jgi:CheY-like chemotaxis protein
MDDEEVVREVVGTMLKHLGYEVIFASDGIEAIDLYSAALKSGRKFDSVIMDLTIPGGMGGKEAVAKLKELDTEVLAIVSSGYSNDPVMANFRDFGFSGCVAKPFRIDELGTLLAQLLPRQHNQLTHAER